MCMIVHAHTHANALHMVRQGPQVILNSRCCSLRSFELCVIPTPEWWNNDGASKPGIYIDNIYIYILYLVGGLEHFLFSIIYGIILPNWLICFRGVETTNQILYVCTYQDFFWEKDSPLNWLILMFTQIFGERSPWSPGCEVFEPPAIFTSKVFQSFCPGFPPGSGRSSRKPCRSPSHGIPEMDDFNHFWFTGLWWLFGDLEIIGEFEK